MARYWKPNAAQRRAYAEKMREQESYGWDFIKSSKAIRVGCIVAWVDNSTNEELRGRVTKSTYRSDNQHSFAIALDDDAGHKVVMGRNLYSNLLEHIQGEVSLVESR